MSGQNNKSLNELMAEFRELVAWFSRDDLDVDAALKKFEQGAELAAQIREKLNDARNKIEIVQKKFDDASSVADSLGEGRTE